MLKPPHNHHHNHHHLIFSLLILFIHLPFSISTTATADIAALKSLKTFIKPSSIPPSSCISTWDFSSDPCLTPKRTHFICGLTCSPDSTRVISITLDSVGYSGSLTPYISQLTQLVLLDLGQNSFHGTIPSSLSSLSLLQSLSLSYNSFTGPLPSSIGNLKSLQDLDLSNNLLSGSIPNTLFSLSHLTRLDLSFNKFSGTLPAKLPPNLHELAIKANSLSGTITKTSFTELTQLETVELSGNSFTGVLQSWLFQLPALQQINLSNNSFTGVEIWRVGKKLSSLVAVDLGFNKIEGYLPVNLSEYPVLASLSLRYNRLRGPIPLQYSKKSNLKRLFLDGNYLSGTPPAGFFTGVGEESPVIGSFGDNCLLRCPPKSELCLPLQKPMSVCKKVYGGKMPRRN
ncbi:MDIS1-interacting receptor like kinase 2 [Beta vulgaris subsp. vulgaris]|uniref:MDIS1-interacting receptor like kinase 2 n=1 Tax=Beta vulgaris subsp. vulgaris TaxID=3555 RepID=UPI0020374771|nr:MDIS1-interacting receptor like kinase 2 [Beta vulgaris subsp. vulgaris]